MRAMSCAVQWAARAHPAIQLVLSRVPSLSSLLRCRKVLVGAMKTGIQGTQVSLSILQGRAKAGPTIFSRVKLARSFLRVRCVFVGLFVGLHPCGAHRLFSMCIDWLCFRREPSTLVRRSTRHASPPTSHAFSSRFTIPTTGRDGGVSVALDRD